MWLWLKDAFCRLWLWLKRHPWLLWILIALLALWLLSWLLRGCQGCSRSRTDEVAPIERVVGGDGEERDNNGSPKPITDDGGGGLPADPDRPVVAPIGDDDPEVVHHEGTPDVVGNRLNIFFEDSDADLDKWAKDFIQAYPSNEYLIIG